MLRKVVQVLWYTQHLIDHSEDVTVQGRNWGVALQVPTVSPVCVAEVPAAVARRAQNKSSNALPKHTCAHASAFAVDGFYLGFSQRQTVHVC